MANKPRDRKHKINSEELITASRNLSKEVMLVMLNGYAHDELIDAHAKLKDVLDGAPDWGSTCTKNKTNE